MKITRDRFKFEVTARVECDEQLEKEVERVFETVDIADDEEVGHCE